MNIISRTVLILLCIVLFLCLTPSSFGEEASLTIPENVTLIASGAFAGDTSITSVTIPVGIEQIGERAFYGCTNIKDVYYNGTTQQWDKIVLSSGNEPLTRAAIHFKSPSEPITLVYAELNPLNGTVCGEMAKAFKAKVEALSNGSITIDLQGSGVLGNEDQILDNLLVGGTICDLCRTSAFAFTQYGCNKSKLLSIPYTFSDFAHFKSFAQSELAQDFLNEPQEIGLPVRGLCYSAEGFRHFFFNRKVQNIEELGNLKIRVSSDPVMAGMVSNLGASAIYVPFSELYSALKKGDVDGAEQPVANYRSNMFQSVAPYLLLDGHTIGATQIVISDIGWAKLTEQQQRWIKAAAQYASNVCIEKAIEFEQNNVTALRNDGFTVVEIPDKTPWREACNPTIQNAVGNQTTLYQQILALQ